MILSETGQLDTLRYAPDGLIPVVAQDARTGEVLMLAWANREALTRTLTDRQVWFWSRSRAALWNKGATSGSVLRLVSLHTDCDADAVLALVEPAGPACHTGARSCFEAAPALVALQDVISERAQTPEGDGYTRRLLRDGNLRLKKLGEEVVELALACQRGRRAETAEEAADLVYHLLVACTAAGVDLAAVMTALLARRNPPVSAMPSGSSG